MATIAEHIYSIQNVLNKGVKSDDSRVSDRLILHFMNIARVLLIKRKADKRKFLGPSNRQGFCMPLCEDTFINCCNMPSITCPLLKGQYKIPKAITGRTNLYVKVYYLSGQEIGRTTISAFRDRQYSLTKKDKPGWFISNDYLYIAGIPNNMLKAVWVEGLFEKPEEIGDIISCGSDGETTCYDINEEEYPIDGELVEPMYQVAMQYLSQQFKYPDDNVNNAKSTEITNDKEE